MTGRYFLLSAEHALDHFSTARAASKGNLQCDGVLRRGQAIGSFDGVEVEMEVR